MKLREVETDFLVASFVSLVLLLARFVLLIGERTEKAREFLENISW